MSVKLLFLVAVALLTTTLGYADSYTVPGTNITLTDTTSGSPGASPSVPSCWPVGEGKPLLRPCARWWCAFFA